MNSSNNIGYTLLLTEQPVVLHSLDYQWQEELKDFLNVYINTSQGTLVDLADLQRREQTSYGKGTQEELMEQYENNERLQEGLF